MMKTSFSTLACPDWTLQEILRGASTYGYDGVELRVVSRELALWKLPEFQAHSLRLTRTCIEDHGLAVASIGSSACLHSPDLQELQSNLDAALRMAEVAAGVGAPSIRVFGDRIQPGSDRTETARRIAESLSWLAEKLKPAGVQVWLETHGDFATSVEVGEIFSQLDCDQAGIIWDPSNAFAQEAEAPLIVPQLAPLIRHVHLKDLRRGNSSPNYVLTGEGDFPFGMMFASLAEAGFDGFISFEWEKLWHPELAPPEVALPHFIKWWKSREGV
jgi:sugar phosphate isomerase/epimerase